MRYDNDENYDEHTFLMQILFDVIQQYALVQNLFQQSQVKLLHFDISNMQNLLAICVMIISTFAPIVAQQHQQIFHQMC